MSLPACRGDHGVYREVIAEADRLRALADDLDGFIAAWLPAPEVVALLHEVVIAQRPEAQSLADLLDRSSLAITQPDVPDEVAEVRVMSLHKSKGLSSPYVFIVGCVEGLLPGKVEQGDSPVVTAAKIEEARRLFYVGITRVKADPGRGRPGYLALTYPQTMPMAAALGSQINPARVQRGIAYLQASRFIGELRGAAPAPVANQPL